ncbi:hypothetical protein A9K55_004889 [Cordyceps militaris]|uniref:Protein FAF1 n=1 Tax=Cordyceps militaris TaxID=73501 RepID=A0A2H4SNI0_CORMI|nr:hypothetical protein A9K55_004889 [Cordyceps militaris]
MPILGKRKSRGDAEAPASGVSELDAEAIFRRHFEAQFEPLDEAAAQREQDDDDAVDSDLDEDEDEDEDNADDDEEEDAPAVQVIDHSQPQVPKEPKMSKKELKAFMSSKVIDHTAPATSTTAPPSSKASKAMPEDAPSLLAQDFELRRLLAESHLFTPAAHHSSSNNGSQEGEAFAAGRTRLKATDLRLQALGSKTSLLTQVKMPMNMRKGIVAAREAREDKRRREAKENGIILERSSAQRGGKKTGRVRKERGVHGPGIGRMRGSELRISEGDVRKIEGSRDTFGRRGRR